MSKQKDTILFSDSLDGRLDVSSFYESEIKNDLSCEIEIPDFEILEFNLLKFTSGNNVCLTLLSASDNIIKLFNSESIERISVFINGHQIFYSLFEENLQHKISKTIQKNESDMFMCELFISDLNS